MMESSTVTQPFQDRHLLAIFVRGTDDAATEAQAEGIALALLDSPALRYVQRFRVATTKPLPGNVAHDFGEALIAEIEGDVQAVRDDIDARLEAGLLHAGSELTSFVYRPLSKLFESDKFTRVENFDDRHLMLIWSTRPTSPEEYDAWYDAVHIRDFLGAPGVIRAQRFLESDDVAPLSGSESPDLGHLAYYEVEGSIDEVRAEIKAQLIDGRMELPDFLAPPFEQIFLAPIGSAQTSIG